MCEQERERNRQAANAGVEEATRKAAAAAEQVGICLVSSLCQIVGMILSADIIDTPRQWISDIVSLGAGFPLPFLFTLLLSRPLH